MPLVYVDSIKYLGFTFRQMRTLYAQSNRIIRILCIQGNRNIYPRQYKYVSNARVI